jgi:prophage maintenance system killer protein
MTAEPRAATHYLTVQDILWINHEVTNEVLPYKFSQLEEATFGQYAYGGTHHVVDQAATFLSGFSRLRPFSAGNRGTALIAVLSFLALNGYAVVLDPNNAAAWYERAAGRAADARAAILGAVAEGEPAPRDVRPAIRTIVRDMLKAYADAVVNLEDLP